MSFGKVVSDVTWLMLQASWPKPSILSVSAVSLCFFMLEKPRPAASSLLTLQFFDSPAGNRAIQLHSLQQSRSSSPLSCALRFSCVYNCENRTIQLHSLRQAS
ncbi:hypothetical protein L6164_028178 [Bauhinia variegata]|uniref:Uncharacterized protein n=1 Tax=Bauhinia variegata TaxID=167791 RepID=A0ACB9LWL9_BAUVA|nr:hypothetical protein L6164_028178 [Bauhinia variegata]